MAKILVIILIGLLVGASAILASGRFGGDPARRSGGESNRRSGGESLLRKIRPNMRNRALSQLAFPLAVAVVVCILAWFGFSMLLKTDKPEEQKITTPTESVKPLEEVAVGKPGPTAGTPAPGSKSGAAAPAPTTPAQPAPASAAPAKPTPAPSTAPPAGPAGSKSLVADSPVAKTALSVSPVASQSEVVGRLLPRQVGPAKSGATAEEPAPAKTEPAKPAPAKPATEPQPPKPVATASTGKPQTEPAKPPTAKPPVEAKPSPPAEGSLQYTVHLASLSEKENADRLVAKFKQSGIQVSSAKAEVGSKTWIRLTTGRFATKEEAAAFAKDLERRGLTKETGKYEIVPIVSPGR